MTITLSQSRLFKSIINIGTVSIPFLTVLFGENGAGKTHLLKAINEGAIRAQIGGEYIETDDIALYDWTDFIIKAPKTATSWQIGQRREQLWTALQNQLTSGKASQRIKNLSNQVGSHFSRSQLLRSPIDDLGLSEDMATAVDKERREIRKELINSLNDTHKELVEIIEQNTEKWIIGLNKEEFEAAASLVAQKADPLRFQISELFLAYRSTLDRNKLLRLTAEHEQVNVTSYLSDDDFRTKYGPPPWEMFNGLLADLGLDFQVDNPQVGQQQYNVSLKQKTSNVNVDFSDLSSGEKVLMALAVSLYGLSESRQRIRLPKLILLDEIDAPLHPDMTRMFYRVINQLLIEQNVGVIMATHNPSTVALAPPDSVQRMSKESPRISSSTRQQALTDLTAGVTALTVRSNERRVVFVEGDSDVDAYTVVLDALRNYLNVEYGLAFFSAGIRAGEGGNDVVRKNVLKLRSAGADTIYGLIDRDDGNEPEQDGSILILGANGRYTLENYLFDPLLLAALSIRQKFSNKIHGLDELLGEKPGTWRGLNRADQGILQQIANLMLSQCEPGNSDSDEDTVVANLVGGQSIVLPQWFVDEPGHKLSDMWMEAIPSFNQFQDEEGLRIAIVTYVVPDVPELLSRDFLDVLADLAN